MKECNRVVIGLPSVIMIFAFLSPHVLEVATRATQSVPLGAGWKHGSHALKVWEDEDMKVI